MFTAMEHSLRYTVKWKEQARGQHMQFKPLHVKKAVWMRMCLAMHRITPERPKILVVVIAFGGENWNLEGQGWRDTCFSLYTSLYSWTFKK